MSSFSTVSVDLDDLVRDLGRAADEVVAELKPVVSRGCANIKDDWRKGWTGFRHAGALPFSIGYDLDSTADSITGTVGPDKDKKQGPLGNIIEFADGSVRSAPHPAGAHALEAEEPRFIDAVAKAGADLLEKR